MTTWARRDHTIAAQKVSPFTGEGAYHGSTRPKPASALPPPALTPESTPTTVDRYCSEGRTAVADFDARFPNAYRVLAQLEAPSQEEVRRDGVVFCWATLDEAIAVAGPITRAVLLAMRPHVSGSKRHVYVDSKIQYFAPGDLPVDSELWHVDGVTAVRDARAQHFGWRIAHDLRARVEGADGPRYLAYQSSTHCATRFAGGPLTVRVPELMPSFDGLDSAVRAAAPPERVHGAGEIVAFDGLSLHRAVRATEAGWRLWLRLTETDREIRVDPTMIDCYGTVFRP
jgi:hypothetical protein